MRRRKAAGSRVVDELGIYSPNRSLDEYLGRICHCPESPESPSVTIVGSSRWPAELICPSRPGDSQQASSLKLPALAGVGQPDVVDVPPPLAGEHELPGRGKRRDAIEHRLRVAEVTLPDRPGFDEVGDLAAFRVDPGQIGGRQAALTGVGPSVTTGRACRGCPAPDNGSPRVQASGGCPPQELDAGSPNTVL